MRGWVIEPSGTGVGAELVGVNTGRIGTAGGGRHSSGAFRHRPSPMAEPGVDPGSAGEKGASELPSRYRPTRPAPAQGAKNSVSVDSTDSSVRSFNASM